MIQNLQFSQRKCFKMRSLFEVVNKQISKKARLCHPQFWMVALDENVFYTISLA